MSTSMLGNSKMLRKFWCGPLADLMIKITGKESEKWETELKKFLRQESCWTNNQKTSHIKFINTTAIPAFDSFIFCQSNMNKTEIQSSYISTVFKQWYEGTKNDKTNECILNVYQLTENITNQDLLGMLCEENNKIEISLAQIYFLLEKQKKEKMEYWRTTEEKIYFLVKIAIIF